MGTWTEEETGAVAGQTLRTDALNRSPRPIEGLISCTCDKNMIQVARKPSSYYVSLIHVWGMPLIDEGGMPLIYEGGMPPHVRGHAPPSYEGACPLIYEGHAPPSYMKGACPLM